MNDEVETVAQPTEEGAEEKLKEKTYLKKLRKLQEEVSTLQDWVTHTGQRIVIVFEGRDAAGKGGIIKALTDRVSPRVFRVVALPAPSDRQKSQLYMQRYIEQFPAAGEVIVFDRSWYNRAGVEYVMGFCTKEEQQQFLRLCPLVERHFIPHRHHPAKILARGQQHRAETSLRGAHRRSPAAVEAVADGPSFTRALV